MRREIDRKFLGAFGCLGAFALWTLGVCFADVQAIGPRGSAVGFAAMNRFVHTLTGVNITLYTITDWLGLVPIGVALGFAVLGLTQWIRRKDIRKVDADILLLGGFYLVVIGAYLFFETAVINYRPVLIDGFLEASYPSSTTMLVMCVMPVAILQLKKRILNQVVKHWVVGIIAVFIAFMVLGRFFSGVHWLSDIIGGGLLSAGLVLLYDAVCHLIQ